MKRLCTLTIRLLGLFAALLVMAGPVWASATSGTIKGEVIDEGGLSVPGALITLRSDQLIGGAQQRPTDDDGHFLFAELPPGVYELTAQKQGFSTVKKTGVEVSLGRVTVVSFEMKVGKDELVVKQEKPTVDTEKASKGSNFNKDFLSRIPSGRSYQQVLGDAAGVLTGGGNPSSGGASTNENTFMLDGVNTTDPVTGTFSMNFNFDAIEEIQVITGGYDPEYGEALGAVVSIVTKSGGNTLNVIANGFYSNSNWGPKQDARFGADGMEIAPTEFDSSGSTVQGGVVVSGPIVKDKVWFLGSYEYNRTRYSNVGIQLPRDYDSHYFFGKVTAQPSSEHRFAITLTTDPTTVDNIDQSTTRILPEAQGRQAQGGFATALKWNWFINPQTNLETTASFQKSFIEVNGVPCTHDEQLGYHPCDPGEAENHVDYTTPGVNGLYGAYTSANYGFYYFDDRYNGEINSKYSLMQVDFLGKHDIKAGIQGNYVLQDQVQGYSGDLSFYDMLQNAFDPDTYTGLAWIEYSGAYQYRASGYHVSAFLQDVYKPVQNLTFRYGLRYDRAIMRNDAGEPIVDVGVFGPRAYVIFDPFADEKSKIYGGYGRFNDTGRLDVASQLSQAGIGEKIFYGEVTGHSQSEAGANGGDYDNSNRQTVFDNTTAPHSDEFSLGAEREVIADLTVNAQFTGKFTRNVYTFDETNQIYDQDGYAYIGSGDGTTDLLYRLRTPTISLRDYYQTDLTVARNFTDRWFVQGTYSYVVSKGRVQDSLGGQLANPAQVELMYGNLPYDVRHQVKVQAAWDIPDDPWTTKIGGAFEFYSGSPLTRYYYSASGSVTNGGDTYSLLKEPRGTYGRENAYWDLSILLQQEIPVHKGKLAATAQVENVTDNHYAVSYYSYYVSEENRYLIAYRQNPITATLGLKYEF